MPKDLPVCVQQATKFHWQLQASTATSGNIKPSLSTQRLHTTSHLLQFKNKNLHDKTSSFNRLDQLTDLNLLCLLVNQHVVKLIKNT